MSTWQERLAKQDRYFKDGEGHFLILAGYSDHWPEQTETHEIPGQHPERLLSEEFLAKHAYDLGIQTALWGANHTAGCDLVDGDTICGDAIDFGVGSTASLFTGGKVQFEEYTSYSRDTFIKTWDDIDKLTFDPENRWVEYDLQYWRGFSSAYSPGMAACPHFFRSPLDLANDLRGNQIFIDLHDSPDEVDRLLTRCTDMIIEAANYLRDEIPLLREAPSGIWGMATSDSDVVVINGDPVDLISPEMGERFNHPHIDRIAREAGKVFFHHHTLGVSRVTSVAKMEGMWVQNFIYDPKAPKVLDIVDDEWIAASHRAPIDVCQDLTEARDIDEVLERMSPGRFIVHCYKEKLDDVQELVARIRRYDTV
jgi:hypothetical protein